MDFTFKKNDDLLHAAELSGMHYLDFTKYLLASLRQQGVEVTETEFYGKTLNHLLEDAGLLPIVVASKVLPRFSNKAFEAFAQLLIFSTSGDCPDCGSDVDYSDDSAFGKVYTEMSCSNKTCDYFKTTEPDWENL
jgi:hypothetical protein